MFLIKKFIETNEDLRKLNIEKICANSFELIKFRKSIYELEKLTNYKFLSGNPYHEEKLLRFWDNLNMKEMLTQRKSK